MTCVCNTCFVEKSITEYHNTNKSKRCRPCTSEYGRKRYASSETLATGIKLRNRKKLLQKYGLTWETFVAMWETQDGKCAICATPVDTFAEHSMATSACVDHCHATGKVRGILCRCCNLGLGYFKDNPELFDKAKEYISG